jgi:phenylacetate-CoA ligase
MGARERWLEVVRHWQTNPDSPGSDGYWAPELELASRTKMAEIQSDKIAAAFSYLFEESSFYRRKFEEAKLEPSDVRSVDDLWKVPITRKEEWVQDVKQNPPWGTFSPLKQSEWTRRGFMMFASSGTFGEPRAFRHTVHDRDLWAWMWARSLWAQGVRPGDILINCFGYGPFTAFWGAHYAMNLIGCPVIPGGGVPTERRAAFITTYAPTVLICTPSYALFLAATMRQVGPDPADSSIQRVIVAGEPGACVPATKRRIEEAWGATVMDIFGGTEVAMAPLGYQCQADAERQSAPYSPHVMEDCFVVEVVSADRGELVTPGETGLSVVSNLFSEAQPILRYEMADLVAVDTSPCPCGRTQHKAAGGILGRLDDLIKVRGVAVRPSVFEAAIRTLPEAGDEFEVVVERDEDGLDRLLVRVEPKPGQEASAEQLRERVLTAVRRDIGLSAVCEVLPPGTLVRPEMKARRLHDRRPKPAAGGAPG